MNELELPYQLAELPSTQHRAGLAGLVLMVRELSQRPWFEERQCQGAIVELKDLDEWGITLRLNLEGIKALFDLVYASFEEERSTETKIKNPKEVKEVEVTDTKGKTKIVKRYYYNAIVPQGAFLPIWDTSSDDSNNGLWVKLWRSMLWQIVRGVPATRNPFTNRLNGAAFSKDAEQVWAELQHPDKTTGQTGQYYLGAMAVNPESVPTRDRVRYQFLLHFWSFVAQVYCPAVLDKDGQRDLAGYALAIPDVANLIDFCDEFPDALRERHKDKWGYVPREAVIDIPEEGALDLLLLLRNRIARKNLRISDLLLGVELIHAEKVGNSGVKIRSISQVDAIESQIDRYTQIKDAYWCPWFRKQRLLNLLRSQSESASNAPMKELPPWYDFDALLSRVPRKWLQDPYFSHDAHELLINEGKVKVKAEIREPAQLVYKVCQHYVLSKLESKYKLKWDDCKDNNKKKDEYNDKKYKIANEAFLAVRSRTESQAFIDYFVSTLYPFVKEKEFVNFADKLFNQTDEIRALTLLALSSQFPSNKKSDDSLLEATSA